VLERPPAREACLRPRGPLDPQELIELGDALAPASGPGLDVPGARGDRQIGDGGVLALAGTVRDEQL
jgi:hypothetical protein